MLMKRTAVQPKVKVGEVIGVKIRSLRTLWALGIQDEKAYRPNFFHRLSQFLQVLWRSFPETVTDLRIIAFPDSAFSQGQIRFGLFARSLTPQASPQDDLTDQILQLLHSFFEEYEADRLSEGEIPKWLTPFDLRHCALLRRQSRWVSLEQPSQKSKTTFGFRPYPMPISQGQSPLVWGMSAFAPDSIDWQTVNDLLLRQKAPVLVSIRCQPTTLTSDAVEFLKEQLFRCDNFAMTETRPALRDQAKAWQQHLWGWYQRLDDAAALVTITLASPEPIPMTVCQAIGALMSRLSDEENKSLLGSGWEVVVPEGNEKQAAIQGLQDFAPILLPVPDAPEPAQWLTYLFDPVEASAVFLLPPAPKEPLTGVNCQAWRVQPLPCPFDEGTKIGLNCFRGIVQPVCLLDDDRRRHVYIVGQTGTGKTTLLQTMILHDIRAGQGLCVLDPHGDLFRQILGKIPDERMEDVIVIDPSDTDFPVGINLLECQTPEQRYFIANEVSEIITRLMEDEYGTQAGSMMGPMFHQHTRMNLLLVMSDPDDPGTLVQFYNIFQEGGFWKRWLPLKWEEPMLKSWVEKVLPEQDYISIGSDKISLGDWVSSKFTGLIFDPKLRYIFGQKRSTFDLRKAMDEGKIVLVNLSKGLLGIPNSRFFGMIFLTKLYTAAMERAKIPENQRKDFFIYVDEFHSVATQAFINLLSEGRKFGVNLVLANQFVTQIRDPRIIEGILGNVGTLICFRLGLEDAERLEREFLPVFHRFDLLNLPNWVACVRALRRGQRVKPFTLETELDRTPYDEQKAQKVRMLSRNRYGRSKAKVEAEIQQSLQKEKPKR